MSEIVGYGRTSTQDQQAGLADQIAELERAGATQVFSEQVSAVDAARPQLAEALNYCRKGDTFVVTKPDRLARSTADLLQIVSNLKARGVTVRILSMDIDTSTATGELMLTLLAAVGKFERELMLERQRAGIAAAKAAGRYKGRAPTALKQAGEVRRLKAEGAKPAAIARDLGIGRASVYRILADAEPAPS
ncbi:recombinase family protein [Brevundimonas subvibrioides]|uniref:Resolvase domain protein n=1 Tax=Brevundimonas subvibrioides (strain ATCC 15264 / DSM 4735 / LMG 14903 / NBRC 16000 / CB 81) TaxID=633149 RepID=D9QF72_BRESC|nr:recombinase family protein [Brevundimonas subvibrioides]ADL00557.1 Resolvase domain protein [Brevundimonas subvibrioides ATCC 15264]